MNLVMSELLQIDFLNVDGKDLDGKAPALKPGVTFLTVTQLATSDQK